MLFLAEVTSELIPDSVIADFYRLADALLFPSREEGFGIPLIEAAFSSVPVFCADIPVLHELGGEDVSYFDSDADPNLIAGQIATGCEARQHRVGRAAQSTANLGCNLHIILHLCFRRLNHARHITKN